MTEHPTLADYAQTLPTRTGPAPWIETIPEWPEILEAWRTGAVTQTQIRAWLIEVRGYSRDLATRNRIAHLSKDYPRSRRANG